MFLNNLRFLSTCMVMELKTYFSKVLFFIGVASLIAFLYGYITQDVNVLRIAVNTLFVDVIAMYLNDLFQWRIFTNKLSNIVKNKSLIRTVYTLVTFITLMTCLVLMIVLPSALLFALTTILLTLRSLPILKNKI